MEQNGEASFDHHEELFAQINAAANVDPEALKDFVLDTSGLLEMTAVHPVVNNHSNHNHTGGRMGLGAGNHTLSGLAANTGWTHNTSTTADSHHFQGLDCTLLNHQNQLVPNPLNHVGSLNFDNSSASALIDSLVKSLPDNLVTDGYLMAGSTISSVNPHNELTWNGSVTASPVLTSQHRSITDKNGNCPSAMTLPVLNGLRNDLQQQQQQQQQFLRKLSPSVSLDSALYDSSASPLSSNRTPIRSDDSISPMTSTPLRVDEGTSPITSIRTTPPATSTRTPQRSSDPSSPLAPRHPPTSPFPPPTSPFAPPPGGGNSGGKTPSRIDASPLMHHVYAGGMSPGGSPLARVQQQAFSPGSPAQCRLDPVLSPHPPQYPLPKDPIPSPRSNPIPSPQSYPTSYHPPPLRAPTKPSPSATTTSPYPIMPPAYSAPPPQDAYVLLNRIDMHGHTSQQSTVGRPLGGAYAGTSAIGGQVPYDTKVIYGGGAIAPAPSGNLLPPVGGKVRKRRKNAADGDDPASAAAAAEKKRVRRKHVYSSTVESDTSGIKLKIKLAPAPPRRRRTKKQMEEARAAAAAAAAAAATAAAAAATAAQAALENSAGGYQGYQEMAQQSPWGRDIPKAVLERVFRFVVGDCGVVPSLVRCSLVCKLWYEVASQASLWQVVDLSSPCIKQKCKIDRYFRWLLENRLGHGIRDLNLNSWKFTNITMVLSLIRTHCTEIESIGLAGWQGLQIDHLKSLLNDCPKLSRIDMSDVAPDMKGTNSAVSPKALTFLTETMGTRLTELNLSHNTLSCLPQIITTLAANCPNLQILDLSNIRRVSHAEFALNVEQLQEGCRQLRALRLTNSCVTLASVPLDVQVASPGFEYLEELSVAGHHGTESLRITSVLDDDCLERMVKNSHRLRLLDVRGCTKITESSLVRVPAWDIQHLYLSGCYVTRQSGSGLELIAQKWSHSLVEVDLAWTSVTEDLNAAVNALAEKGIESPLRILNLCGSAVEIEPVRNVLSKCPHLESLNLQSCRGLPRGVKRLYEGDQLQELRLFLEREYPNANDITSPAHLTMCSPQTPMN